MNEINWKRFRAILLMVACASAIICLVAVFFFKPDTVGRSAAWIVSFLKPFLYGAAIAYLLRPLCLKLEALLRRLFVKNKNNTHAGAIRTAAMLLSLILMLLVIVLLLLVVIPELVASISKIVKALPDAITRFEEWIRTLDRGDTSHEVVENVQTATTTISEYLENFLQTEVLPNLQSLVSDVTSSFMGIVSVLKNFGLGCIISAYLLGGWEKFTAQAKLMVYAVLPRKAADWVKKEVRYTDTMFNAFIHGKVLDSVIIGIICFIFMLIARMPYALLISVIVGVTNIIPFFGPYLGAIPSALLLLMISPTKCLVFLVFIFILQQFDGNILGPKILGDRMGLSGIWILFSILFFGSLWGLVGMLVGVPLFAVLYDLVTRAVRSLLDRRGRQDLVRSYDHRFHEKN